MSLRSAGANLTGSLLGSRAAVRLMRRQPRAPAPAYHIFNLGFSGWGARFSRTAATHKSSKTGLTALTAALAQELRDAGAFANSRHVTLSIYALQCYFSFAVQRGGQTLSAQRACACGAGLTSIGVHNLSPGLVLTGLLLDGAGLTSIGVHNLSPGLVLTGLLLDGASPAARRFFNTLTEEPDTVATALVPRMRAIQVRL